MWKAVTSSAGVFLDGGAKAEAALPRLIRTTLPKACLTWFGRNTDLCVSSRAFDQDHLECGCEYPLDLSRSQRHRTTVMPGTTTITLKCDHGEGVNARSPPKWLSNTTSS
jgi:hypothetical protein